MSHAATRALASILAALSLAAVAAQERSPGPDALLLYQRGRDLEAAGKADEAAKAFAEGVAVCDAELAANPARMDSYVVKSWCLLKLKRYQEIIDACQAALKQGTDWRIIEMMGEAYYYLGDMASSLRYMQRYVDSVPENTDRVSSAYFFMGEAYLKLKQYEHADIAYSIAVYKTPDMYRWWYRLGMAREALGDRAGAIAAYEKSASLNRSNQDAAKARDRLAAEAAR
jgi:tetratricopeptide (TPR) repeat protein